MEIDDAVGLRMLSPSVEQVRFGGCDTITPDAHDHYTHNSICAHVSQDPGSFVAGLAVGSGCMDRQAAHTTSR